MEVYRKADFQYLLLYVVCNAFGSMALFLEYKLHFASLFRMCYLGLHYYFCFYSQVKHAAEGAGYCAFLVIHNQRHKRRQCRLPCLTALWQSFSFEVAFKSEFNLPEGWLFSISKLSLMEGKCLSVFSNMCRGRSFCLKFNLHF